MRRSEILDECQREDINEDKGESLLRIKDGEDLKKEINWYTIVTGESYRYGG
jgi:hypothetical protein